MLPAVFQFLADKYLGNFKVVVMCAISSTLVSRTRIRFTTKTSEGLTRVSAGPGVGYDVITAGARQQSMSEIRERMY